MVSLVMEDDVASVWQMERTDIWNVTFESSRPVTDFNGQEVRVPDHRVVLEFCACDEIVVRVDSCVLCPSRWVTQRCLSLFFLRRSRRRTMISPCV